MVQFTTSAARCWHCRHRLTPSLLMSGSQLSLFLLLLAVVGEGLLEFEVCMLVLAVSPQLRLAARHGKARKATLTDAHLPQQHTASSKPQTHTVSSEQSAGTAGCSDWQQRRGQR